jgi:hypothetical protein
VKGVTVDDSKWERWGALGGILFVVLVAVSAFLPGSPPKPSDSTAKIVKFVADNGGALRWAAFIGALAVVPLFWWLGSVWRVMRRGEGGTPRLAVGALGGAIFAAVMATLAGILLAVLPIVGVRIIPHQEIRFFFILSSNIGFATEFGVAVFVGAFSLVIMRSRVLPPMLGWLGALLALITLVGGATVATTRDAIFDVAFVGFLGFLIWVLAVSILMLRGAGSERAPAPAPTPAASAT